MSLGIVELSRFIARTNPTLIVVSTGAALPPVEILEFFIKLKRPFVTVAQANFEDWWPVDDLAARYRLAMTMARKCYFVSQGNLELAEKQIGSKLKNADIVRNPFKVPYDIAPPWPTIFPSEELRFASVARLEPAVKGQDLIFEVLSKPPWNKRRWRLTLYGEGPYKDNLARLAEKLGIAENIYFAGYESEVVKIWEHNHVLLVPSRYEGMPIALVEAMLCGRVVIATDIAGHGELIKEGVTGFLAQGPNVVSLACALERMWNRIQDFAAIGDAASVRARQIFPADPVSLFCDRLEDVIRWNCEDGGADDKT